MCSAYWTRIRRAAFSHSPRVVTDFVLNRIRFYRTYRTRNLVARGTYMPCLPDLLQDLTQVVRLGTLQRRKFDIRLEFLQPQDLADGQQVPVINISRNRTSKCAGD